MIRFAHYNKIPLCTYRGGNDSILSFGARLRLPSTRPRTHRDSADSAPRHDGVPGLSLAAPVRPASPRTRNESMPSRTLRFATFLAPNIFPVYQYVTDHVGRKLGRPVELVV